MGSYISIEAKDLKDYIEKLADFAIVVPDIPYNHMGATICDAVLQAGLNWESVVKPRLDKIKKEYAYACKTGEFSKLLSEKGVKKIIDWRDDEKPQRIMGIVSFFVDEGIETETDLKKWLEEEGNVRRLKKLRGVGDKTADYFKWLAGIPTTAIDRHMMNFLKRAGISPVDYREAQSIIHQTADLMGLNRTVLDHSIWKYMSQRKGSQICTHMRKDLPVGHGLNNAIRPHGGDIVLRHTFDDTWDYLDNEGSVNIETTAGTAFEAIAGIARNDEPVIKFVQNKREYARAYACCWGHYYNCNRTRFGMYAKALDEYITVGKR